MASSIRMVHFQKQEYTAKGDGCEYDKRLTVKEERNTNDTFGQIRGTPSSRWHMFEMQLRKYKIVMKNQDSSTINAFITSILDMGLADKYSLPVTN